MEYLNLDQYRQPQYADGKIPVDMGPLMTKEQYKVASDIKAQGYDYTEVAKAYNTEIDNQNNIKDTFYKQLNYNEHIGVQNLLDHGSSLNEIMDNFGKNPKQMKALLNELGSNIIEENKNKAELSQDGFTGATLQNGKNASQIRTLLGMYDHRIGLSSPEQKLQAIQIINSELGTNIRLDENGKLFDMAIDGHTKIDLEPGIVSGIQNNAATIFSCAILAGRFGAGIGQSLGLRILTDFYRLGLKIQMKTGAKLGLVSGTLGGMPDFLFEADGWVAKNVYLNEEYQGAAQKILDNPYDNRVKNLGINIAGDVVGGAAGPALIKGVATGINKTSDFSLAIANAPTHIKNKFNSIKDTAENAAKSVNTEYGILNKAKRRAKRIFTPTTTVAEEMNTTIADSILTKNQNAATKTLSKIEQTDAFLKESGWSDAELKELTTLDKLILTNLSSKTTARPMIEQMSKTLGIDDAAIIKNNAKLIAQNQLDSVVEFSNAVQNNTLSPTSMINNINEFIPNIKLANNAVAKQYERQLVTIDPNKVGNFKPAIVELTRLNTTKYGDIRHYSLFDKQMSANQLEDLKVNYNALGMDDYFAQNKLMRKTTYFGLNKLNKNLSQQEIQSNLENVGLDDYMRLIVDLELNADKLRTKVSNIDEITKAMRKDIMQYESTNNMLLDHMELIKQSANEAKKVMQFYSSDTNIGKQLSNFRKNKDLNILPQLTESVLKLAKDNNLPNIQTLANAFKVNPKDLETNFINSLISKNITKDASGNIDLNSATNVVKSISNNKHLFTTPEAKYVANQIHKLADYNANFVSNINSLASKTESAHTSFLATSIGGRAQMFLVSRQWQLLGSLASKVIKSDSAIMDYTGVKASKLFTSGKANPNNIAANFKENLGKILSQPDNMTHIKITKDTLTKMVEQGRMQPNEAVKIMKQYGALIDDIKTATNAFIKAADFDEETLKLLQDDTILNNYLLTGQIGGK